MKAAILDKYDKNGEDVEIRDVPVPKIASDDVLVKIVYAGVNPLDNMIIRGEVKLITPYKLPLVMGNEFSGIVEELEAVYPTLKRATVYMRGCLLIKLVLLQSSLQ